MHKSLRAAVPCVLQAGSQRCPYAPSANPPDTGVDAGAYDKVCRLLLLQHEPHAVHIIPRMAPVPLCIQVAQRERLLHGMHASHLPRGIRSMSSEAFTSTADLYAFAAISLH